VAGEHLDKEFFGYGPDKRKAKEQACLKMALSGHCVSVSGYMQLFTATNVIVSLDQVNMRSVRLGHVRIERSGT
jgi:hypothetical protein